MVVALSYLIAVLLTIGLAVILYPIAGAFWVFGLLGKVSEHMFGFTRRTIRALWRDIRGMEKDMAAGWTCSCGCQNTGKFCSECGAPPAQTVVADVVAEESADASEEQ